MTIGSVCDLDYISQEFQGLDLKDVRLHRRSAVICQSLLKGRGSCIRSICDNSLDARAAYDFFSNAKVSWQRLHEPHMEQTIHRIQSLDKENTVLVLHDTSVLNYTTHKAKTDIGRVGKGNQDYYGILQHTCLAVTPDNTPLGLVDVGYYDYDMYPSHLPRHSRSLNQKATGRWCTALSNVQQRLESAPARVIHIADREADFYECLKTTESSFFLIRCRHVNRSIILPSLSPLPLKMKLIQAITQRPILGTVNIEVYDSHTHTPLQRQMQVQVLPDILIPCPDKKQPSSNQSPVRCHVIRAFDDTGEWILLTNMPVDTIAQADQILQYYRCRWHIESYFKVLKTALGAEKVYLHSSREAILNLLTLLNIMAVRLYWVIFQARHQGHKPALQAFTSSQIIATQTYLKLPLTTVLTIQEAYYLIARLGGYKPQSTSPPGTLTMTRAFQILEPITQLFLNMSIKT